MVAIDALKGRQRAFVSEYVGNPNSAKQAAIRAGYSAATAESLASRLLRNVKVQLAIEEARTQLSIRTNTTLDETVHELAGVAYSSMRDVARWTPDGVEIIPSDQLSEDAARSIQSIKVKRKRVWTAAGDDRIPWEVEEMEVKLHSKVEALDKLMRYFGAYKRDNEQQPAPNTFLDARVQVLAPVLARLTEEQQLAIAMRMLEGEE